MLKFLVNISISHLYLLKHALIKTNYHEPKKITLKIGEEKQAYDCSNNGGVIGSGQCGVSKAESNTKNERKHHLFMGVSFRLRCSTHFLSF